MSNNHEAPVDNIDNPGEWNNVLLAYARDLNANASWLAYRLLALESGGTCVVTSSGVGAINGRLMAY